MRSKKVALQGTKKILKNIPTIPIKTNLYLSMSLITSTTWANDEKPENISVLPTIEFTAQKEKTPFKNGNMDITRTENDIQAYKIIDNTEIENSGATSISELIQKVLPMASNGSSDTGGAQGFTGTSTQINLRGLGASQTLVLINGRRTAGIGNRGTSESTDQPNLSSIPLAAIERIEVLPTSASAIYGGGAVGGIINVILKKNYVGNELNIRYGNNFNGDADAKTINLVSGFSLEDGKTNVLLSAQYQNTDSLSVADNPYYTTEWRNRILKNNPNVIYGANRPPVGNGINIIAAKGNLNGLDSNKTFIDRNYIYNSNTINNELSKNQGNYALGLSEGVSSFSKDTLMIPESENTALNMSINRSFNKKLDAYLDVGYNKIENEGYSSYYSASNVLVKANSPINPFKQDVYVTFPASLQHNSRSDFETETKNFATGLVYKITPKWALNLDYQYSKSDVQYSYARPLTTVKLADVVNNGSFNPFDPASFYKNIYEYATWQTATTEQELNDYSIRASGPLFNWYAGDVNLTTGIEYRDYKSKGQADWALDVPWETRKQNTLSFYGEMNIPLISPELNLAYAKLLDIQLAARHERYNMKTSNAKFESTTPTIGFRFAPIDDILVRASYSEAFVAPAMARLAPPILGVETSEVMDPLTNQLVNITTNGTGNPNLKPEESKSYNFGLVLTPSIMPDVRLSVDYYKIKKSNNQISLSAQDIYNNQDIYADRIHTTENGIIVDTGWTNALSLETSGLDTSLGYTLDTSIYGQFDFNIGYTHVFDFLQQDKIGAPENQNVNIPSRSDAPLKNRANFALNWQPIDNLNLGWNSQFYSSYKLDPNNAANIQTQGSEKIGAQIYHDIFVRTGIKTTGKKSNDVVQLTAGIKNLFDHKEFDVAGSGYYSKFNDPRGRQLYLNLKYNF
ncbi:TonB-dependent receptor [Acinetobacter sp. CFCC 10889]|uniref:TonB-dependent receptor n=1 Tax=Acinetobacter sp. CFCC 10889 TaxID=1775557 RepID=UPI000DD0DD37|nr:TonB-dependent receptor [Acinetobacter sp. CFCC 10889]